MVGEFILMYLLFPVVAVVLAVVTYIVAQKNQLLSNKKLILVFLLACLMLTLPALLGFIDYWFMPYAYICLQVFYFFSGWYFLEILQSQMKDMEEKPYYVEFLSVLLVMLVSGAFFSLVFNLCNELQYGMWACSCMLPFIFPSIFRKTYQALMDIPIEVYKMWSYDVQKNKMDEKEISGGRITVVEMELFKQISDLKPLNITAKADENMLFGVWFKVFIDDYNFKSPQSSIVYGEGEKSHSWIFYTISLLGRKRHIDPDLSFADNKIKEHRVIVAKRAQNEDTEEIID
jgi:hypothetical protein